MTDVVALATELVALESPTGAEGPVVEFVGRWLAERGWTMTLQDVSPGRRNVWARRAGGGVTLSTHLDTVPPHLPPAVRDGGLYGRGACDAKGIAAAMLVAAERLAARGERRVDLLFVVGEEKGSDGARAANLLTPTSRFLINGEPTESRLATATKGSLRVALRTSGRAAHSAYPHLGRSAVDPLLAVLADVRAHAWPSDTLLGPTTVNVGMLRAGVAPNVIPDAAEADLLFRVVGDVDALKADIEGCVAARAEVAYGAFVPPERRCHTVPGFETDLVAYTTDVPLLARWGTPLLFGPGSIHVAHTLDEHIDLAELRAAVDGYERLVTALLGSAA